MSVYNKIGGGANKVLIDNKPPENRLNLTEVEATIQYPNSITGEKLLEEKGDWWIRRWENEEYFLYKGNPAKGFTKICSLKEVFPNKNYLCAMCYTKNGILTIYSTSEYNLNISIFEVKNGIITLKKNKNFGNSIGDKDGFSMFIIDNILYIIMQNKIYTTDLNTLTTINRFDYDYVFFNKQECCSFNNKRYSFRRLSDDTLDIYSFNGKEVKLVSKQKDKHQLIRVNELLNAFPEHASCLIRNARATYSTKLDYTIKRIKSTENGDEVYVAKKIADNFPVPDDFSYYEKEDIFVCRDGYEREGYIEVKKAYVRRE